VTISKKQTQTTARPAARRKGPENLDLPDLAAPPDTDDPEVMAAYFVEMLEALGRGDAETRRIRDVILGSIESYRDNPNRQEAREIFAARLAGLEEGVTFVLLRHTKRLRDRLVKDSRKLGTGSEVGRAARVAAEGFSLLSHGLQKLLDAAASRDPKARSEAQSVMRQAHAKMKDLEAATRRG
jgi:hypothetical protein